jgi:membrane-associated protease RseP (regulator of RpoE activity)
MQGVVNLLQRELMGIFQVRDSLRIPNTTTVQFAGILQLDPDTAYAEIERRFATHGYTPYLQEGKFDEVLLIAVEQDGRKIKTGNPLVNLVLLLVTITTTLFAGAGVWQTLLSGGTMPPIADIIWEGLPFTIGLLGILGVHEFGHYIAARYHGVAVTLPYFIPMPFGFLGTLGAFISLRSPMKNRKVLFDIGVWGPLAGFAVAVPVLLIGLWLSPVEPIRLNFGTFLTLENAGTSLLVRTLVAIFKPIPAGQTLIMHPIFFAAWIGLLVTGINLIPVGQLDGGHIAYALFGKWAHTLALVGLALVVLAGVFLSINWLVWALFMVLGGLKHPPPMNDVADIGWSRRLLGWFAILLFFLVMVPTPFGG